jgi:hypothetical protein
MKYYIVVIDAVISPLKQLVAHGDYSSIANCRTAVLEMRVFRGIFGIFRCI